MSAKKKTGLFFGTFNPIHIGHLIIANYLVEFSDLDEVWLVVTPHNPLKKKRSLLEDHHRLAMVRIALEDYPRLRASNVEFDLPQPNYTINTLVHLEERYPDRTFSLIVGEDNLRNFHKWKNADQILENYHLYVYPRLGSGEPEERYASHPRVVPVDAPVIELSATFIRKAVKEGKNIRPMLPEKVWQYMDEMNFYR